MNPVRETQRPPFVVEAFDKVAVFRGDTGECDAVGGEVGRAGAGSEGGEVGVRGVRWSWGRGRGGQGVVQALKEVGVKM